MALYYMHPSVLLTKKFSEKMYSEKKEILIFQNIEKNLKNLNSHNSLLQKSKASDTYSSSSAHCIVCRRLIGLER